MDMLSGNVRRIYFKYLTAAFGSALISSIYGIVDMAMVGSIRDQAAQPILSVNYGSHNWERIRGTLSIYCF